MYNKVGIQNSKSFLSNSTLGSPCSFSLERNAVESSACPGLEWPLYLDILVAFKYMFGWYRVAVQFAVLGFLKFSFFSMFGDIIGGFIMTQILAVLILNTEAVR